MHRTTLRLAIPLALAAALAAGVGLPASAAVVSEAPSLSSSSSSSSSSPSPSSAASRVGGISGWARMEYGDPRDDVQVSVDAHGLFAASGADSGSGAGSGSSTATRPWGTFRIQHYSPPVDGEPGNFNWGDFRVDCLRVEGTEVSVTGRLVDAGPAWKVFLDRKPLPARMGLSFHVPRPGSGDATRIGLTPPTIGDGPEVAKCATRPPEAGVTAGGYSLLPRP
ncbi:hypothetical protein AB0F18_28885 [Streptomyces sp. NPDC029216]|uniref:hypothetical protein n=1 Tax=Streptomyces sp. NPDC029216 TaxID=3154701 RepID=UPI0034041559